MLRKSVIAIVSIVIIIVAGLGIYVGLTYPRTTANIPVSFTVGADSKTVAFEQPILDDKAQVMISVHSGAALWHAQISNGSQIVWEHTAAQGQQQSYLSDWITIPSGSYNFTFGTIGGSLDATASITSKGGVW